MSDTSALTVYKASAGSGKTFTLAIEYIKLLMSDWHSYENILAVTFTNKATGEMKLRILSQLYGLAYQLPDSKSYMDVLCESTGLQKKEISRRAGMALKWLLHNYHHFRVQTIDKFFQAVLRNLARELQLSPNLRVDLNEDQVVSQAVDEIVDSIADDKKLRQIVQSYVDERIEDDKRWDVTEDIKKFGKSIFLEKYKRHRKDMQRVFEDDNFFIEFKKKLRAIKNNAEEKYTQIGKEVMEYMEENGLTVDDFTRKNSGVYGYFVNLSNGKFDIICNSYVRNAMDGPDGWVTKTSRSKDRVLPHVQNYLLPKLLEIESERADDIYMCNSARHTLKKLNDVMFLKRIEDCTHQLNEEFQRFMLADTQSLLNDMIDKSDSPFIFEKIGAYLQHIMIDEFQDTSVVQWENFKTLLLECMSHEENNNLIVGDVKQSIYRFRSGDWRLLNDIDKEFEPEQLTIKTMQTNWRSKRNVINFNNAFFKIAAELEANAVEAYDPEKAESLRQAYADVEQKVPEFREVGGLVSITMLPNISKDERKETEEDQMLVHTLEIIKYLKSNGAKESDIAVLCRKGKELVDLANYIEENSDIKVISAEAFKLSASKAVMTIVSAMKVLAHPKDNISAALLKEKAGEDALEVLKTHREELLPMTLHDMAEELLRLYHLNEMKSEGAYITTFFDYLQDFSNDMAPVLEDFLTAWDEEINAKTIEAAESDGVRFLTIHKSKGLEFDHVIMPYATWKNNNGGSTIWVEPKEEPFNELPLVPLEYKSVDTFKNSIYYEDGVEEHIQEVVDNLNLLYVGMTRAGRSLYIIGERATEKSIAKSRTRSALINEVIKLLPDEVEGVQVEKLGLEDIEQPIMVSYGELSIAGQKEEKQSDNPFIPKITPVEISVQSYQSNAEYRQSNESRRFADDAVDETDRQRLIRKGTVMHQIFSMIRTIDDVDPVLRRMEFDGTLYDEDMTRETLLQQLHEKFENDTVREWFSDKWQLYNECKIITKDGEWRPDRVMTDGRETIVVDFKFGKPHEEHKDQVRKYMTLLKEMQMPDVKGYLWYVESKATEPIVEVK